MQSGDYTLTTNDLTSLEVKSGLEWILSSNGILTRRNRKSQFRYMLFSFSPKAQMAAPYISGIRYNIATYIQ